MDGIEVKIIDPLLVTSWEPLKIIVWAHIGQDKLDLFLKQVSDGRYT